MKAIIMLQSINGFNELCSKRQCHYKMFTTVNNFAPWVSSGASLSYNSVMVSFYGTSLWMWFYFCPIGRIGMKHVKWCKM